MKYEIKKIAGIDVIFADMPDANSTTVLVLAKAGNVYESRETNGISHFLEHMFFKGGKKYRTAKEVAETIDQIGGEFNAFTGEDFAGYYVKSAPEHVLISVDVLGDMLVHPAFPKDELEREKGVVIQEIMMYEDVPQKLVMDKFRRFFYGDNSYGWSILGPVSNIKSFDQTHFFSHKESLYTKDNLIIVVAGKISNQSDLESKIYECFDSLGNKKSLDRPVLSDYIPGSHIDFLDKKTQQNHIVIGTKGFDTNDDRRFISSVLSVILGGNMSSRLFQEIREKRGLCYYIGANHYPGQDDGIFMIRAGLEKDRFDYGVEEINKQLADIAKGNISREEFDNAIGYVKGITQMGIETSDQFADFLGEQYLLKGKIISMEEILQKYSLLKYEDLFSVTDRFDSSNLYTYYIK